MAEGLVGGEGFAVDASLIKADANRQNGVPGKDGLAPEAANHAVREYLAVLDDAAFGAATPVVPKFISPADPAARWTAAYGGQAFFAYATNYLIDLKHAVIMDVEATTAVRQAEVGAARTMIGRTQGRFGTWPEKLVADAAYGSAENLAWLVHERGIEPHIPVFDKSRRRDGTFSRSDFAYDHDRDLYICPDGKELRQFRRPFAVPRDGIDPEGLMRYRAIKRDCDACFLKPRCCPKDPARKILRSIHEGARDMAARYRRHRCLRNPATRAEEGRDAVCAPEAHPQTRSPAPARTMRRPRRVPPRSHRPEPQENGEAEAGRSTAPGGMRANALSAIRSASIGSRPSADFFNTIGQFRPLSKRPASNMLATTSG
jgi:hypothetical protein